MTLGIDIGTSGARALIVSERGKVIGTGFGEYPISTPRALWAEQDPHRWWTAAVRAVRGAMRAARIRPVQIKGVGLTGQMHGLVLLDDSGRVLRPAILWNDQRTEEQCAAITEKIGFDRLLQITGNPVLPGFTAPKILWVRDHEPRVYDRVRRILLPKDFVRYKLTGDFVTDVSDASGTSLLDVRNRRWSPDILTALGVPPAWMPSLVESPERSGSVGRAAAKETGIPEGTPVVGGGGDQAAGAVGTGIVRAGAVSVTIGTSGVVFAHSSAFKAEPRGRLHAFCHASPGSWHLMGVTLSAGGSLRWFRDTLAAEERALARSKRQDAYDVMCRLAGRVAAGSEGLLFLPYLTGERTPHADPRARGLFLGLTIRHTKAHMIRSVLEGVALSLRDCMELMKGMGVAVSDVRVSGGGARSRVWRQILADVLNMPLSMVRPTEGAAFGAALLASVGIGVYGSVTEACGAAVHARPATRPSNATGVYETLYSVYKQSYLRNQDLFRSLPM